MDALVLHGFHAGLGARFTAVNGREFAAHYGDPRAEHAALRGSVGLVDLSGRSRLVLLGADRAKLLHGQVTNNVRDLAVGEGCYAALVNAKGRLQSDLHIHALPDELLLDFEPGYAAAVAQRLEKYIIAEDVQVVDAAPHYGLLSLQGPLAGEVIARFAPGLAAPVRPLSLVPVPDPALGECYLVCQPRVGLPGFDLHVPNLALSAAADRLRPAVQAAGGLPAGWEALEIARVEAGIPRFGADMDETNLPPEAGIEDRAISYTKGCYIGQEIIARLRTYGQVAKALRGLRLADDLPALPARGDKLVRNGREVGYVTSAARSPVLGANIALGYVRRECNQPGTELVLRSGGTETGALVTRLPFVPSEATAGRT